jgi:hypothetical protein
MTEPELIVPFSMRMWMDRVEAFLLKANAYLAEVETRLAAIEEELASGF